MKNCLIMGSGRCGTSMVAGTLNASGYFTGDDPYGPDVSNPKGFFECPEINNINEEILAHMYPDMPHGSRWLIDDPSKPVLPSLSESLADRITKLVSREPYGLKDTRFCRTWAAWMPFLKDCAFICMFRHPASVIDSMLTVNSNFPFKVQLDEQKAERVWCQQYLALASSPWKCPWLFMRYDQMFTDGFDKLETFLGATLDKNFRDENLDRHKSKRKLEPGTMTLYRQLCQLAGCDSEENQ